MDKATSIRCHATHVIPGAQTDEDGMFSNFTVVHQRLEIQLVELWVSPRFLAQTNANAFVSFCAYWDPYVTGLWRD